MSKNDVKTLERVATRIVAIKMRARHGHQIFLRGYELALTNVLVELELMLREART